MHEPKIMRMDWKSLGYEREYKDGRLRWVPRQVQEDTQDTDTSAQVVSKPLRDTCSLSSTEVLTL